MKPNKKSHKATEPLSFVLAVLAVGALAACFVVTWLQLRPASYEDAVTADLAAKKRTHGGVIGDLPELKLNQQNERQGPEVTVDPNQIGKPDPFQP